MKIFRPLLPTLLLIVAVAVSAGSLSAAVVSCTYPNVDCSPCCPGCSACSDFNPCVAGSFTAINHPSTGDRTGFTVCGEDSSNKTVTFTADGKSASLSISGFSCVSKHLDELTWNGGQPQLLGLGSASFSVSGPNPLMNTVSMVTAITFTGTDYNLYKLDRCVPPRREPDPGECPPDCFCDPVSGLMTCN